MNVFVVAVITASILTLAGCDKKVPDSTDKTKAPVALGGEITLEGELPSLLTEGLTPEEKI